MKGFETALACDGSRIRSAVTVSFVPEAKGGPFVFWDGLEAACEQASHFGFDALEIFPPDAALFQKIDFSRVMAGAGLGIAAIGTGAGWVKHKLRLTDPSEEIRRQAVDFIGSLVTEAAGLKAPVIVGSMQGRWEHAVSRDQALEWLSEGLSRIDHLAREAGTRVLVEPLNRYETNLLNTVGQAIQFIQGAGLRSTLVLADLFHMNIEETDTCEALREAGAMLGHVHFADTNRRAMGFGQADSGRVARTLVSMGYSGYVSAEVFPLPDGAGAASQTAASFRALFRPF